MKLASLFVVPDYDERVKVKGVDIHSYSCVCPRQDSVPRSRIRIWNLVMFLN